MTEEQYYNAVIDELKVVEKDFESQMKDFITTNSIDKPLYTYYKTSIIKANPMILGTWDKNTPDFILTLLQAGLELAKARVGLRNFQSGQ